MLTFGLIVKDYCQQLQEKLNRSVQKFTCRGINAFSCSPLGVDEQNGKYAPTPLYRMSAGNGFRSCWWHNELVPAKMCMSQVSHGKFHPKKQKLSVLVRN